MKIQKFPRELQVPKGGERAIAAEPVTGTTQLADANVGFG